ncbi:MAG: hypothetical protein ABID87_00555 [Chloroflexota bacterium]
MWKEKVMIFRHGSHRDEAKKLPKPVCEYMKRRFVLLPEYLDTLRCFHYQGLVNGREVSCFRVFSPCRAQEHYLTISRRGNLDEHPEMMLFEGYINRQGGVYVADRRPPLRQMTAGKPKVTPS